MTSLRRKPLREHTHVWPVMSDSVNAPGGEREEKNKQMNIVLQFNVLLHSLRFHPADTLCLTVSCISRCFINACRLN